MSPRNIDPDRSDYEYARAQDYMERMDAARDEALADEPAPDHTDLRAALDFDEWAESVVAYDDSQPF